MQRHGQQQIALICLCNTPALWTALVASFWVRFKMMVITYEVLHSTGYDFLRHCLPLIVTGRFDSGFAYPFFFCFFTKQCHLSAPRITSLLECLPSGMRFSRTRWFLCCCFRGSWTPGPLPWPLIMMGVVSSKECFCPLLPFLPFIRTFVPCFYCIVLFLLCFCLWIAQIFGSWTAYVFTNNKIMIFSKWAEDNWMSEI